MVVRGAASAVRASSRGGRCLRLQRGAGRRQTGGGRCSDPSRGFAGREPTRGDGTSSALTSHHFRPRGTRVNAIAECTVPEKILLAAYALEEAGQSPF